MQRLPATLLYVKDFARQVRFSESPDLHGCIHSEGNYHALRGRGIDVLTAQEDGAGEFSDSDLLDRATELGRILFSRDEDLLMEAAIRQRNNRHFSGLVYAHQLRVTVGQCINDLEILLKLSQPEEMANRVEHLPLR